ncbi:hypothetical protein ElyMa_004423500 [Elysia marginata]|uniref:Transmembrane protein n=1 Tax=Elysia marginata TaxID=1093978 RepID=A0AAV4HCN9_9GAST|nr:hypothetical protein ElyMa_004423500 [Elysia marginata]
MFRRDRKLCHPLPCSCIIDDIFCSYNVSDNLRAVVKGDSSSRVVVVLELVGLVVVAVVVVAVVVVAVVVVVTVVVIVVEYK